ncbi:MAG: metallophosphoesterase [Planctomycetota bacterium]
MPPSIFGLFASFIAIASAVALTLLLARRDLPLDMRRIGKAALGVLVVLLSFTALGLVGPVRFRLFGVMQLVWLTSAVAVPLSSIAVLAQIKGGRATSRAARWTAILGLGMVPTAIYGMVIEPNRLVVEVAEVAARTPLSEELRIGVLSDIQCSTIGAHEREACARLMAEAPDIILIAGDLFQGSQGHFDRTRDDFIALLQSLEAPGGVWVVRGDVDSNNASRSFFDEITDEAGVRVLIDEHVRIMLRGQAIELYGYDRWGNDKRSLMEFLRSPRESGAARIVLAHRPDPVLWLDESLDLDLFVAGHTHGGQVVIPFFGPPVTLSKVPREVGAGGMHRVHGVPIYVSRGVGMERGHAPRVRFFCPPEVAVVTLRSGPPQQ